MLIYERVETGAAGMTKEVMRGKPWKNGSRRCQDIIREKPKSLVFDEKIKLNISKDCLTKHGHDNR